MDMKEIWTIDCDALFQNYKNFCTWHQGSAFGGLVFGRCTSREIFLVLFVSADILNAATVKFLTSSLSADLELVGNLLIEGEDTHLMGDGFILKTSKEVLDRGDITSFLVCNEMLKFAQKKADGISIRVKDYIEFTAFYSLTRNTNDDTEDQKMVPIVRITKEGLRRRVHGLVYVMINGLKKQMGDLERVRAEVIRLEAALQEAIADKHAAAEVGLGILKEKEALEVKLLHLQDQYESAKQEVEQAKQTLAEFRSQHKAVTRSELENEQTLLEESSAKERLLTERIGILEANLRTAEQELERSRSELERLHAEHSSASDTGAALEEERRRLKAELKEIKDREQRMQTDYYELEEENIALQKTACSICLIRNVANLRGAQVEFESLKIDCSRYAEEIYMLNTVVEESQLLKSIAEKQVEEALLMAQQEREQRLAMKKELEAAKNAEHLNSLTDMLMGLERLGEEPPQTQAANDLFSELQGNMDEKIRELEAARDGLEEQVKDREKAAVELIVSMMGKLNINFAGDLDYKHARQQKDVVLERLDHLLKGGQTEANADKRALAQRADIRTLLLLAGEKSALLAAFQDTVIQMSDQLYQFYHQMVQNQGLPTDKSIVNKLRQLAKENAEDLPKVSLSDEGVESGTETDGGGGKAIPLNSDRVMLAPSFIREVEPKLTSCKVCDVASESDMRQRILTGVLNGSAMSQTSDSLKRLLVSVKRTAEQALNQAVAVEELEADQRNCDEEKRTLNQLLRLAIQQKLALTQRLEDVEVDRDRQVMKQSGSKRQGQPRGEMYQTRAVRYPPTSSGADIYSPVDGWAPTRWQVVNNVSYLVNPALPFLGYTLDPDDLSIVAELCSVVDYYIESESVEHAIAEMYRQLGVVHAPTFFVGIELVVFFIFIPIILFFYPHLYIT
uniref:M protein repeat protein n=1 Tax=Heterorhabditis bacteriophora TaxID=37862 RepID=A0A1I7WMZ4_HETBA